MKGDGSYYETKDRAGRLRWVVAVYVPGRTSPVRRWLPVGATDKQAKQALRKLRDERAQGKLDPEPEPEPAPDPLPTMAEAAETWIAAGYPGGRKAGGPNARTRRLYDDLVRLHLARSALGRMRLDAVRRRDVAAFLADEANAGASRSVVQKLKGVVSRTYRHAQLLHEEQLGERVNPADVDLPVTKEPAKRRALLVPEIVVLLDQVTGDRLLAAWLRLAMDTGMRPGEQAALTSRDLDLERRARHGDHREGDRLGSRRRARDPPAARDEDRRAGPPAPDHLGQHGVRATGAPQANRCRAARHAWLLARRPARHPAR